MDGIITTKELWNYEWYYGYKVYSIFYVVDPEHIVKKVIMFQSLIGRLKTMLISIKLTILVKCFNPS